MMNHYQYSQKNGCGMGKEEIIFLDPLVLSQEHRCLIVKKLRPSSSKFVIPIVNGF